VLVDPSPKDHNQALIGELPGVDWSVNCTTSGAEPLRGYPLKSAAGSTKTVIYPDFASVSLPEADCTVSDTV